MVDMARWGLALVTWRMSYGNMMWVLGNIVVQVMDQVRS